jgi:hypothetical protein
MRSKRLAVVWLLAGALFGSLIWAPASPAGLVTVGAKLPMEVIDNTIISCPKSCVVTNPSAAGGSADVVPVDGVVVHWRLYRGSKPTTASPNPGYRLRLLTPLADAYLAAGTSSVGVPAAFNTVEVFSTHLPVKAGQLIALEVTNDDSDLRFGFSGSATSVFLEPSIHDGGTAPENLAWEDGFLFPFNADVLPPPRIHRVNPSSGSFARETRMTVTGDNFTEVTGVAVDERPVAFTVDSESQISAVTPPLTQLGSAPVTVATAAGSVSSTFDYEGCVVPKLKAKSLKASRKMLAQRQCKLGEVRKRHGATAKTGRVKRQRPPRGTVLPLGGTVEVALGLHSAKR